MAASTVAMTAAPITIWGREMTDLTFDQKVTVLRAYGWTVGERDPRLNTAYPGTKMVMEGTIDEVERDHELPTVDGRDGPWCLVGDDLVPLVDEAFDFVSVFDRFDEVVDNVLDGGDGVL